jgi:lysophospholipase L1-like esterase
MPQNGYIRICAATAEEYLRLCLESEKYKTRTDYHGIKNLYNPITSPCNVVLLGDSNTYGQGLTDRTKAWSGFYQSAITNLPQNVFCNAKVFTGYFVSQSYQNTIKMGAFGKVYFKVYTDLLSLKFEYIGTVNITIDGVAQPAITSNNPSYELEEGLHEVVLEATSGNNNIFHGFTYHQLRTCVNNAVSGTKSSSLENVDISLGNLFVVMFGTNDRELDYGETMYNLSSFIMRCKDADKKVILLSPIPPLQETHSAYKINIGQVVSQFANVKPLVKYIDTYSVMEMYYLIYTKLHNTAIYSDGLHLNDLGHRLLWSAIAPKLGFAMHISDLIVE